MASAGLLVGTGASLAAGPATSAFAAAVDCSGSLGTAGQYSEWVAGSAARGQGTIGGAVAYGGSATFGAYPTPNGPTIATREPANASTLNLIVGGAATVDGPTTLDAGSGKIAGAEAAFSSLTVVGGGSVSNNVGVAALPFSFSTVGTSLAAASKGWAQASGALAPGISGATLTLTGTNTTQDIFDVAEAQLTAATSVVIDVPTASPNPTILINVTGSGTYANPAGQAFSYTSGGVTEAATTLWNFNTASKITLSGITWQGTIVAPSVSSLSATNGTVDGSLIIGGSGAGGALTTATSSAWNTNLNLFSGVCLPSNSGPPPALPEGRPLFLGAIALATLASAYGIVRRRRPRPQTVS
jgi:choice-of-anchor A domain-containing protein